MPAPVYCYQLICQQIVLASPVTTVLVELNELITNEVPAVTTPTDGKPIAVEEFGPQLLSL
jgi:hypothetical protein